MTRSSSVTFNTRPLKAVLDRCSHFLEAAGVKNVCVEWQCKYQQPMLLFRIITTAAGLLLALTLASLLYLQQVGGVYCLIWMRASLHLCVINLLSKR